MTCFRRLVRNALFSSGTQFPVAGYVWEDMNGNGTPTPYVFRDGLTVGVRGAPSFEGLRPSRQQIENAISSPSLTWAGRFARINATTREEFRRYLIREGLSVPRLEGLSWVDVIRAAYQEAWQGTSNSLLRAKAMGLYGVR
ncbi:MAG: hypothetical protein HRT45_18985 [Bdellovibrionales bacterium]|nr:hypothetical protein [Bdellovibrionales bacterium]